ncbi:long tail fiber distal subunit [Vibrio phage PG216]|nr:long tail fiber distal subunit [Vibrio phage PG216]
MAELRSTTAIGGNIVWHGGNLRFDPQGETVLYNGYKLYTENDKPDPHTDLTESVVKRAGDVMSGDLQIAKSTAQLHLSSTANTDASLYLTEDNGNHGVRYHYDGDVNQWQIIRRESNSESVVMYGSRSNNNVVINGIGYLNTTQRIFADNYHPNADKWTTARTLTLSGEVTGSVSIDGSSNVTISTVVPNHTTYAEVGLSASNPEYIATGRTLSGVDTTVDWDTLYRGGFYNKLSQGLNRPVGFTGYWYAQTMTYGSTTNATQVAYPYGISGNSGTIALRTRYADVWEDWVYMYHTDYHPEADKWTTARTLTLSGDVSGSVSFDGSSNISLAVTVADDSHTHDGRYYTEAESDARFVNATGDTMTGYLNVPTTQAQSSNVVYGFGGTSAGKIGSMQLASGDIDDYQRSGFIDVNSSITGTPAEETGWMWGVHTEHNNGNGYAMTLAMGQNSNRLWWKRRESGVSSAWMKIFDDEYHPNADKWTTARTLTLNGDVSGSASIDGSSNVTLSVVVANDSHTHDGRYYTETEADARFAPIAGGGYVQKTGDTMSSSLFITDSVGNTAPASETVKVDKFGLIGNRSAVYLHNSNAAGEVVLGVGGILADNKQFSVKSTSITSTVNITAPTFIGALSGNASTATTWANARTLALSGDLSGSVSINGSSDVTLVATVINDSHTHNSISIQDTRAASVVPNDLPDRTVSAQFTNLDRPSGLPSWYSALTVKGWSDAYQVWQLISGSNTLSDNELYFRRGLSTSWESTQRIFMDDYHPNADKWTTARTLTLNGDVSGSASIDGSANVTLSVAVADDSHNHTHSDGSFTVNGTLISTGVSSYDKIRVWSSGSYTIGMASAQSFGWLNDYAMTFTMNNDTDRGFLWRDEGDAATDGAMSLTTGGNLMVKNVIALGGDTTRYMQNSANEGSWVFRSDNGKTWHFGARNTSWIHNSTDATSGFYYYQSIQSAGNITAYSDARVKTNVERITNPLEKIDRLNGYTYDRTDVECPRQTGVIAQEVLEVLPEAVVESGGDADGHYAVAYGNMVGLLIEGIKEEKRKREALEERIARLEALLS